MTTYWQLPNNKSYLRIDRNGLNTAIGEAILKSYYPEKYVEMNTPIEERESFKNLEKSTGKKLVKGNPPEGLFMFEMPELEYYNIQGTSEWHPFNKKQSPHRFLPLATEQTKGAVHALIRHPVHRFISFINRYTPELHTFTEGFNITEYIDDVITKLSDTPDTEIFLHNNKQLIPQVIFLDNNIKNIKFYRYPEHISNLIIDLKLTEQPVKEPSTLIQSITLCTAHEEIIKNKFTKDLELFNRINYPGIILEV